MRLPSTTSPHSTPHRPTLQLAILLPSRKGYGLSIPSYYHIDPYSWWVRNVRNLNVLSGNGQRSEKTTVCPRREKGNNRHRAGWQQRSRPFGMAVDNSSVRGYAPSQPSGPRRPRIHPLYLFRGTDLRTLKPPTSGPCGISSTRSVVNFNQSAGKRLSRIVSPRAISARRLRYFFAIDGNHCADVFRFEKILPGIASPAVQVRGISLSTAVRQDSDI